MTTLSWDMYAVVYVSVETTRFSDSGLDELLAQSRRKNLVSEITGLLLYKDGNFMQILEGPQSAVLTTLAEIKKDSRHRQVKVLLEEEIPRREFKDWSMGFRKLNAETSLQVPGYSDFLNLPLTSEEFVKNPSKSFQLLHIFRKSVL